MLETRAPGAASESGDSKATRPANSTERGRPVGPSGSEKAVCPAASESPQGVTLMGGLRLRGPEGAGRSGRALS